MSDTNRKKCVLALGFFDGVHLGHAALLRRTLERAAQLQAEPAVMARAAASEVTLGRLS